MTGRLPVNLAWTLTLSAGSALTTRSVTAAAPAAPVPNGSWPVYHHDNAHSGTDPGLGAAISASPDWVSATLDQEVYAEPLVHNGLCYTATRNNTVYAIDQATGGTNWSTNLGAPTTGGWVGGNVSPTGILG